MSGISIVQSRRTPIQSSTKTMESGDQQARDFDENNDQPTYEHFNSTVQNVENSFTDFIDGTMGVEEARNAPAINDISVSSIQDVAEDSDEASEAPTLRRSQRNRSKPDRATIVKVWNEKSKKYNMEILYGGQKMNDLLTEGPSDPKPARKRKPNGPKAAPTTISAVKKQRRRSPGGHKAATSKTKLNKTLNKSIQKPKFKVKRA